MPRWGCVAAVLLLLSPLEASNWNVPPGQIGDWSVAGNWTGGLPTSSSTVNIGNGGTVTVTLPGAVYANLALSNGWVQMSDGTLTGGSPTVTNNGSFIQSGGTHTVKSYLGIKSTAPSGGYNLSGGGLSVVNESIGDGGVNGSFVQTGGTHSVTGYFYLGYNATGTYDLSGGSLSATGDESLSKGIFTQSGGTNTVGGTASLNCNYTLSGAGLLTAKNVQMGGSGAFTQTGGTNNITNSLSIRAGSQYYYLSGSGRLSAATETLDGGGFMIQAGGVNTVTELWLGYSSKGTYDLRSGALSATTEYIGYYPQSNGTFVHRGGSNTVGTLRVGYDSSGPGYYTLDGSAQLSATVEYIGDNGIGTLTQTGGTNTVGTLSVGHFAYAGASYTPRGTYNLSGHGILTVTGTAYLGQGNTTIATFTQTGGSSSFGTLRLGDTWGSSGTCNLSGGTMTLGGLAAGAGTANFNFNGGTLRAGTTFSTTLPLALNTAGGNATFDTAGYTVTLSGALSGPGNLIKTGSGTLVLATANSYTGPTAVTAGTLSLTGSLNAASALVIGDAMFSYTPAGSGKSQTVAGLTVNAGASTINVSTGNTLALGSIVRNTAGVVDFNSNTAGTNTTSRSNTNGILGPWATYGSGTSTQYATVSAGAVAAYTGATNITFGVTGLTDTTGTVNYAISSGGGALSTPVSANTAWFTGASNTLTVSTANSLSLNGIMNVGSGTATITGGDLTIGATKELVITGPGNVTIQSPIRDNASGQSALTVAGSGTLLVSGANTYSGDTVVCAGTLQLGNAAALPQGAGAGNLVLYKTLDLNNFSTNVNGLLGNGVVTSSAAGTPTLTVGNNNVTSTFSGIIQNGTATAVALTKIGSGTLSLTGNHTYTGVTTVAAGKLSVTGSLAAGSAVAVNGGGMFGGSGNGVSTGIVNGPVTVVGGSSAAAQGALDLIDNSLGTLYLGNTLAFGGDADNPAVLNLEFGSAGFDMIALSGGLTLNAGGGVINLNSLGSSPVLGTYNLLTFANQAGTGMFTFPGGLSEQIIGNRKFILNNTGTAEQIIVNNSAGSAWTGGGTDGNWTTVANWVGGTIPGLTNGTASADTATFNAPTDGRLPIVIDAGRNVQNLLFDSIAGPYTIGSSSGNALLLSSGGSIQTTPLIGVTQVVAAPLVIQGSAGAYTFASNATANALSLLGSVTGSATSGNTTQLTLDGTNTSSNTISGTISDGPAGGSLAITKTGAGTWVLSGSNTYTGGTTLLAGKLSLSSNSAAGTGPFTLVGGTLSAGNQYVGSPGVRSFTQSGGSNSGSLYLGYTAGTSGTYQMTAGTLTTGGIEYVGYSGTGTFTQSGGTHTFSSTYDGNLYIGYNAGSVGTYEMSGTGLLTSAYWEDETTVWLGYSGTGYFTQTGGTVALNSGMYYSNLYVGYNASGNGTYRLDSGLLRAPSQYVGYNGTGTFTQSGGKNTATTVTLGINAGSSGTYNLNGGTLVLASLTKGNGTAAFNFGGGTLQISSTCTVPINLTTSGGNATIDTGTNTVSFSAPISGPGNLIKIGSGTLTLTAPNTYLGPTNVTAGKLYVNDSLSPSGAISVSDGTTLGGRGSAGNVTVADGSTGGTIEAGQSNNGSLTLSSLTFDVKGTINVANIGNGDSASILTASTLAANGASGSVSINVSGPNLLTGTYKLIGHSGPVGGMGGFAAFKLGTVPTLTGPRVGSTPFLLVDNAGEIDVQVSNDYILWTGAATSEWSTATIASPKNWKLVSTGAAADYLETVSNGSDAVVFDDSAGTGPKTVNISAANVKPMSVVFGNSTATSYTLQSSGSYGITGATGLTKSGNGTLVIRTVNSYTGSTVLNGGLLQIGVASSALGSGSLVLAGGNLSSDGTAAQTVSNSITLGADVVLGDAVNNGPLTFSGGVTLTGNRQLEIDSAVTLSGAISGAYSITKNGGGTLVLSGTNSYWYAGKTILNAGTLAIDNQSRLGVNPSTFVADQLTLKVPGQK
jgi:autotransporter-associated beta strand protein